MPVIKMQQIKFAYIVLCLWKIKMGVLKRRRHTVKSRLIFGLLPKVDTLEGTYLHTSTVECPKLQNLLGTKFAHIKKNRKIRTAQSDSQNVDC